MEIEDFISEWIDNQCSKFAAEIEEIEALMKYLKDYQNKTESPYIKPLRVMPGTEEVSNPLPEAIKKSLSNPIRCRCGDWTYGDYNTCGPNGCYNCPA